MITALDITNARVNLEPQDNFIAYENLTTDCESEPALRPKIIVHFRRLDRAQ